MRKIPRSDLVMETRRHDREGTGGVIETAREKIAWIIDHQEPEPLHSAVQAELNQIVAAADPEIGGFQPDDTEAASNSLLRGEPSRCGAWATRALAIPC